MSVAAAPAANGRWNAGAEFLRRALISSYATQAYVSLIGLVMMPVYLHYMGAEAIGMVGFFLMLQAFLQLLDFGLSPCLAREMSLFRAGVISAPLAWARLRGLEWILGSTALAAMLLFLTARNWIAVDWLKSLEFSSTEVSYSLTAMIVAAAMRWLAGLYRSGLIGLERQMLVNFAMSMFATLKFVGVVPLLVYWSAAPLSFFAYQAVVGVLELTVFLGLMYRALPGSTARGWPEWQVLRGMLPVAAPMAFMSLVWVLVLQLDKLVLSATLPLNAFGHFTVAAGAAGSVLTLVPPLNQVLQPRMTVLVAQGRSDEVERLYCTATQVAAVAFAAMAGGLAFFAEGVLWAWTGSRDVAHAAAPILFWYGLANGIAGILSLPFMLQFAKGYLRLHVIGNVVLGVTLLPALVLAAIHYGAIGAGVVLFGANLIFLVVWIPIVYRKLMPQLTWRWLAQEVGPGAAFTLLALFVFAAVLPGDVGRMQSGVSLVLATMSSTLIGLATGTRTRGLLVGLFRGKVKW